MSNLIEGLTKSLASYSEFLRSSDLIKLGIYRNRADITIAKQNGTSPPYVKVSVRRFLFPKSELIKWISEKYINNNDNKNRNKFNDGDFK